MKGNFFDTENNDFNRPYIIIVEGSDDANFFDAVLAELNVPPTEVRVAVAKGKDNIGSLLGLLLKHHAFASGAVKAVALVRDADDDLAAAERELNAIFKRLNEAKPPNGQFARREDGRHIGLFLLPGANRAGDLETLCLSTANNSMSQAAEAFIDSSTPLGGKVDHRTKRATQAYLSIASLPLCAGVGWAMKLAVFDVKSPQLDEIKEFVRTLISL